jgi:hypothetical protein
MLEFRKTLPSFKDKERLLQAIARNQVNFRAGYLRNAAMHGN